VLASCQHLSRVTGQAMQAARKAGAAFWQVLVASRAEQGKKLLQIAEENQAELKAALDEQQAAVPGGSSASVLQDLLAQGLASRACQFALAGQ
jgi:hypothetical protein